MNRLRSSRPGVTDCAAAVGNMRAWMWKDFQMYMPPSNKKGERWGYRKTYKKKADLRQHECENQNQTLFPEFSEIWETGSRTGRGFSTPPPFLPRDLSLPAAAGSSSCLTWPMHAASLSRRPPPGRGQPSWLPGPPCLQNLPQSPPASGKA